MNGRNELIENDKTHEAHIVIEDVVAEKQLAAEWEVFLFCTPLPRERKKAELYGPLTENWLFEQPDAVKQQLSAVFMKFLQSLWVKHKASDSRSEAPTLQVTSRTNELLWLENNKEMVRALVDNWVAVEGDELIAASPNFAAVLDATRKRGIKVPFIVYVPRETDVNTVTF